jgi:hypothetical protein
MTLAGGEPRGVRKVIRDSWLRARDQGLHPDRHLPPVALPEDEVGDLRREHALARVWPLLADTLRWATSDQGNLLFLSDAAGHLLWIDGQRSTLHAGERIHLMAGALWSEEGAGTSGVGTALTLRRPLQVIGAEHYLSVAAGYTCTAAPIRDPLTGEPVGVIDLTYATTNPSPMVLSLLITAARLAEAELRTVTLRNHARLYARYSERLSVRSGTRSAIVTADGQVVHADPRGWLPAVLPPIRAEGPVVLPTGRTAIAERLTPGGPFLLIAQKSDSEPALRFEALGRDRARLHINGTTHELSRRHSEIIAVLLGNPGGLGTEELRHEIYGPAGKAVTLRAELARVRSVLGHRLASEPYRLTGHCVADFLGLDADLSADTSASPLDRYPGPLLPASSAPGVVLLRERLHERLRGRIVAGADSDSMTRWLTTRHGRGDRQVAEALAGLRAGGTG